MNKESFYFPHDYEPTSDPKIQALLGEFGAVGYGVYWRIIEMLHSESTHKLPLKQYIYLAIAKQMLANDEQIIAIIQYCIKVSELFVSDTNFFWSNRVLHNFEKRAELSEKRSLAGKAGAIAKQNLANRSKEKKRIVKEIEIKEYIKDKELNLLFIDFLEMRKKINKPATEKAIELLLSKLNKLSSDKDVQRQIIEQSIIKNYQGLFPIKNYTKDGNRQITIDDLEQITKNLSVQ